MEFSNVPSMTAASLKIAGTRTSSMWRFRFVLCLLLLASSLNLSTLTEATTASRRQAGPSWRSWPWCNCPDEHRSVCFQGRTFENPCFAHCFGAREGQYTFGRCLITLPY